MPIYEFKCTTCGNHFDRLQKLSDPDPDTCPDCGKPTVKRCLTAPSFRLAGAGWYETDFKKDGDSKRNLAGKDEAPKTEPKPESANTKPAGEAAKSDTKSAAAESKPTAPPANAPSKPSPTKNNPAPDAS
jgi:putative FmdB family regulatory protein